MTTRVTHLQPVCEYGGCERIDTTYTDGYLFCPPHQTVHVRLQAEAEPKQTAPAGWHPEKVCEGQRVRERDYLMRLLQQQRREIDQLITFLEQPRPASMAELAYAQGELIVREGAAAAGFDLADLTGPSRVRQLSTVRQWLMYRCHLETGMTLIQIGRLFERDHTTVLHAIKAVRSRLATGLTQPTEGAA